MESQKKKNAQCYANSPENMTNLVQNLELPTFFRKKAFLYLYEFPFQK